jgi:EmrB/QacA subfamily drug resistance transporter
MAGQAGAGGQREALAPGTGMALVAMALGVFVIANDFTALNVALPAIEEDFDVDVGTAQWVINAYALFFGLAIVTGGRLADMFGRKRIFFIGAGLFAGFSLIGAVAPSIEVLIGARVGMGFGGALIWPAVLGMTYAALPASRAALAGGMILGVAGIGNAVGPMLGGALTELISWRAIFFLNIPVAAIAVAVTAAKIHQDEELQEAQIDWAGMATLSAGLLLILVGLDQSADWGFGDPRVITMFLVGAGLVAGFAAIEPRLGERALVPKSVMQNPQFAAACLSTLMISAVFFVVVLYVPQFLIKILDYTPLEAGLGLLPMMGTFAVTSFYAARLYERFGPRAVISAGAGMLVIGTLLLSFLSESAGYTTLIPGLFIVGMGVGLFYSAVTTAAVTALPDSQSSLAGGLVYMFQIAGGALGLAAITTLFTRVSEAKLSDDAAAAGTRLTEHQESVLHGLLAGTDSAMAALAELGASVQAEIVEIVRDSFVAGMDTSFKVVAAVALGGLVIAVRYIGRDADDAEAAEPASPAK